jgi:hypothetical protein
MKKVGAAKRLLVGAANGHQRCYKGCSPELQRLLAGAANGRRWCCKPSAVVLQMGIGDDPIVCRWCYRWGCYKQRVHCYWMCAVVMEVLPTGDGRCFQLSQVLLLTANIGATNGRRWSCNGLAVVL